MRHVKIGIIILFLLITFFFGTGNAGFNIDLELTSGPGKYAARDIRFGIDFSKKTSLGLDFSAYSSTASGNSGSSFTGDLSTDLGKNFLLDLSLGNTPLRDNYKSNSIGASISLGIPLDGEKKSDSSDYWVDTGLGFNNTNHLQYLPVRPLHPELGHYWFSLEQKSSDFNAGITFYKITSVSLCFTGYSYNRNLNTLYRYIQVFEAVTQMNPLQHGLMSLVNGFPKNSSAVSLKQKIGEDLDIDVSKTVMSYVVNTGSESTLDSTNLGFTARYFYPFEFGLNFELSSPDTKYSSLKLSYYF